MSDHSAATPRPWGIARYRFAGCRERLIVADTPKGQDAVAGVYDEGEYNSVLPDEANARLIVEAVNTYDAHVELEAAARKIMRDGYDNDCIDALRAALTKLADALALTQEVT